VSLSLEPVGLPRLTVREDRAARAKAGSIFDTETRRGANNITVTRVAGRSERHITLKVFSDRGGVANERFVVVPKGHGRGGKKGRR
jgi:hypothetical protein